MPPPLPLLFNSVAAPRSTSQNSTLSGLSGPLGGGSKQKKTRAREVQCVHVVEGDALITTSLVNLKRETQET